MAERCPCGTRDTYADCCGRLHRGEAEAVTAEQLMRSRYAAYLRRTWHPATRPAGLVVDVDPDDPWTGLDIVATTGGGMLDSEGTVSFEAHHRDRVMRERSRFARVDGRWVYVDALPTGLGWPGR